MSTQSKVVRVTPQLSGEWLTNSQYANQRKIRQWHVDDLSDEMLKGRFIEGTAIHFANLNGRKYLVNGQHTLNAIVQSGKTIPLTVVETQVNSEEGIAALYYRYDTGINRSLVDAFKVYDLTDKVGLTYSQIRWLAAAIATIEVGFRLLYVHEKILPDDMIQKVIEWSPYMRAFLKATDGCNSTIYERLKRKSSLSVALVTFRYYADSEDTHSFWRQVALDDGLHVGDPRKALNKWLAASFTGSQRTSRGKTYTIHHACLMCAQAWNYYVTKRELKSLHVRHPSGKVIIIGTPYDDKNDSE